MKSAAWRASAAMQRVSNRRDKQDRESAGGRCDEEVAAPVPLRLPRRARGDHGERGGGEGLRSTDCGREERREEKAERQNDVANDEPAMSVSSSRAIRYAARCQRARRHLDPHGSKDSRRSSRSRRGAEMRAPSFERRVSRAKRSPAAAHAKAKITGEWWASQLRRHVPGPAAAPQRRRRQPR